jgi:hypothetical protein
MASHIRRTAVVATTVFLLAGPLGAQPSEQPPESQRATELSVLVGGAASAGTGAVAAGIAGWELNRWTSIEARGAWFAPGDGSSAFSADVGGLFNIIPRQAITPYVGASIGLYRAMFDSPATPMPSFYRFRVPMDMRTERLMFTDPAFRFTGGVEIVNRRRITVRPEASSMIMWRDGRSEAITMIGVRFGYRFEDAGVR